jgi:uncharacterized repeat protein (TIGR03803 family)
LGNAAACHQTESKSIRRTRAFTPPIPVGVVFFALVSAATALSQTYTVLHTFTGGNDGAIPTSPLVVDSAGNLFGTTLEGGSGSCYGNGCGTIFEITASGNESVIHAFTGTDGWGPTDVVRDPSGNLYGTASIGGQEGSGTVFELSTTGQFSLIYTFGSEISWPVGLVRGPAGDLYGATSYGGSGTYCAPGLGCGSVFKIIPQGLLSVLQIFAGPDGAYPEGVLIRDTAGNLYGTTVDGGAHGFGEVFKMDSTGTVTVLYSFEDGIDGGAPEAGVVRDSAGNLYGTTLAGGDKGGYYASGCGVVFKLDTTGRETVLHAFQGRDGAVPQAALALDSVGNLYGTTSGGGAFGYGTIFKVSPSGVEKVLYSFTGGTDGSEPAASLLLYEGDVYGTASAGGINGGCLGSGCGVVFKLSSL